METRSGNCELCGIFREVLHRDHKIPKAMGGTNDVSNIQRICANCHQDKTREDLKRMDVGARCSQGRAKAWESMSEEQRELRREQLRKNGKKAALFMKSMDDHDRALHGNKVRTAQSMMSHDAKEAWRERMSKVAQAGGLASKESMSKRTPEERQRLCESYRVASQAWHDSLSEEAKLQWRQKISAARRRNQFVS